jgi:hypothetical protein
MSNVWLHSVLWIGLALLALISICVTISVVLIEILVGAFAGNLFGLQITEWVNFLAGFGAIVLTFLAAARSIHGSFESTSGQASRSALSAFSPPISAFSPMPTKTGFNRTELGKITLSACFINDLGTCSGSCSRITIFGCSGLALRQRAVLHADSRIHFPFSRLAGNLSLSWFS